MNNTTELKMFFLLGFAAGALLTTIILISIFPC